MKYILHIDTSSDQCNIFLSENGEILQQKTSEIAKNHAAIINIMIDDVLKSAGIGFTDLKAIAIIGGPGSYTGLRIGLATAKGICYANDLPLIMHNKLDLLATQTLISNPNSNICLAILPAREKEFFICMHTNNETLLSPKHVDENKLTDIINSLDVSTIITGLLTDNIKGILHLNNFQIHEHDVLDLPFWSQKSLEFFNCNKIVNLATTEPFYLKSVYINKSL